MKPRSKGTHSMDTCMPFFLAQLSTAALASISAINRNMTQALSAATIAITPTSVTALPKIFNALSSR